MLRNLSEQALYFAFKTQTQKEIKRLKNKRKGKGTKRVPQQVNNGFYQAADGTVAQQRLNHTEFTSLSDSITFQSKGTFIYQPQRVKTPTYTVILKLNV